MCVKHCKTSLNKDPYFFHFYSPIVGKLPNDKLHSLRTPVGASLASLWWRCRALPCSQFPMSALVDVQFDMGHARCESRVWKSAQKISEVSCCVWHCAQEEEETKKLRSWILHSDEVAGDLWNRWTGCLTWAHVCLLPFRVSLIFVQFHGPEPKKIWQVDEPSAFVPKLLGCSRVATVPGMNSWQFMALFSAIWNKTPSCNLEAWVGTLPRAPGYARVTSQVAIKWEEVGLNNQKQHMERCANALAHACLPIIHTFITWSSTNMPEIKVNVKK